MTKPKSYKDIITKNINTASKVPLEEEIVAPMHQIWSYVKP